MGRMPADDEFGEAWRAHRTYLVGLAFRMLGDIGEAEDVVQEAFSRLLRAGFDGIDDLRGWLIVVTSRLCLDQVKSARARRERVGDGDVVGAGVGEIIGAGSVDPADRVTLDDNVRLALLVVLDRLSPAERVVFVLHDVFQMPFGVIAETVGRTQPSCRQLAHRARRKIAAGGDSEAFTAEAVESRLVTDKFVAACASGSLEDLVSVLDPDAWGDTDLREGVVTGATDIARNMLLYWFRPEATLVALHLGSEPSILAFVERRLVGIFSLAIEDGVIKKLHLTADPRNLRILGSQVSHAI
jgi:RNA polymerase sigma-70 factor (ECF subfamily)